MRDLIRYVSAGSACCTWRRHPRRSGDALKALVTFREEAAATRYGEDGGLLSIILSKAFLLAADTAITDPSITPQIRGRR